MILVGSSGGAPLAGYALDASDRVLGGFFIGYVWVRSFPMQLYNVCEYDIL